MKIKTIISSMLITTFLVSATAFANPYENAIRAKYKDVETAYSNAYAAIFDLERGQKVEYTCSVISKGAFFIDQVPLTISETSFFT